MASGVKVGDDVKEMFEKMKLDTQSDERIRVMALEIEDRLIRVTDVIRQKDIIEQNTDAFEIFKKIMLNKCCCYMVYDCHYEKCEQGGQEDLVFSMWTPDSATVKAKMHYASSKNALKNVLKGVKHVLQLNSREDIESIHDFATKLGGRVLSIEGKCCGQT
ncbi:non-muscle cofilin 1-like [Nerophis lumbriciformis]|uniref:non-muscle cofilin 1-like n=1 Tax=Nerophis lumbriciformis TaxID=546530 RepID=UPI002ADF0C61|nr:cofilin-1-A-like [Nerophis lumbriciformis]